MPDIILPVIFLTFVAALGAVLYAWLTERARGGPKPLQVATWRAIRMVALIGGLAIGLAAEAPATLAKWLDPVPPTNPERVQALIGLGLALVMLLPLRQQIILHRQMAHSSPRHPDADRPAMMRRSFVFTGLAAGLVASGLFAATNWIF